MAFVLTLTAVAHAHPERLRPLVTHLHHTAATASLHVQEPLATAHAKFAATPTRERKRSHQSDLQG